ncbi:alpha/beta hydrolase [Rhizobium sp. TH2]|uniref:alpha/beta hydrolase n=1 Tax=Rhizobium sp. TH2 TaxID=2775403 RepID=UPI00215858E9|nr:alpha/beta hydrolase [Rhizobium sp. TH2]UVC09054.1 alpha/beta hydrolase [Rhizobium sp. TH2]
MQDSENGVTFIEVGQEPHIRRIAAIATRPDQQSDTTVVWLGGYRSDMSGTKAVALEAVANKIGVNFVRFDYSGHGQSSGHYTEGTISLWLEEALAVIARFATGRLILVGSSMGGWVALRAVEEFRKEGDSNRTAGLVLIAPAPDFTHVLIEPHLTKKELKSLADKGYFEEKSDYSPEPNRYTRDLIEDGRHNLVMNGLIVTGCPVHILQGMKDPDVPYGHALKIMEKIVGDDAILTLVRDGDHRLSRPEDLERIEAAVTAIAAHA